MLRLQDPNKPLVPNLEGKLPELGNGALKFG